MKLYTEDAKAMREYVSERVLNSPHTAHHREVGLAWLQGFAYANAGRDWVQIKEGCQWPEHNEEVLVLYEGWSLRLVAYNARTESWWCKNELLGEPLWWCSIQCPKTEREMDDEGIFKILKFAGDTDGTPLPATPHTTDPFNQLLDRMRHVHASKDHDYSGGIPYANCRRCEELGIPAWKGVLMRISDKFSRLVSFAKNEELRVSDESIEDTLLDMANYALICLILYREAKAK